MKRLWLMPIEPFEHRYTAQWLRWFGRELPKYFDTQIVIGDRLEQGIAVGEFLDVYDTNYWKASQAAHMVECARANQLGENDVVLFLDAWNPAVEMMAYIRDAARRPFKIAGLLHAGTYDPHDFLTQRGLGRWASASEMGWLHALDAVFVATDFHKRMFLQARGGVADVPKVHVTGFPLYASEWSHHAKPWAERKNVVVFPHRLAPEKQPGLFTKLARQFDPSDSAMFCSTALQPITCVKSAEACKTKDEYYALLGSARVAVSYAEQETWGIAMLEALSLGCWPLVPDRLSYPETMPSISLCPEGGPRSVDVLAMLEKTDRAPWGPTESEWYEGAISRIARICERL